MTESALQEDQSVVIALILARSQNGVIGNGNALPWHLPADLRHFKRLTLGKPVVMGRKTFVSIGRPLPRRTNIVVTRDAGWTESGVIVAHDLPTGLALAYEDAHRTGVTEVMIIGGAEIFRAAVPMAQRIYLTEIHRDYAGDVRCDLDLDHHWRETSRERVAAEGDAPEMSFVTLERSA